LKDYTEGGKTAAQIIYETAQSVGINPQVILATLQKEQSLVTDTWPWPVQYQKATGMGCPEGAECNSIYYGFTNQVLRGSQLLKAVYNKSCNPIGPLYNFTFFNTYAGTNRTLDGKSTYVGNCATAAFYQYTPHRPDSAYLTATDGSHYYGNYNLISNLKIWFNITNGKLPVYRFYNMKNGTHFYTANEAEKINVINKYPLTYRYEAVVFVLDNTTGKNTVPLYRFYNMKNGSHFYTANEDEKNNVIARWPGTFKFEGPVYSVAVDSVGTMPVYRFWNIKGTHFYTANEDEKNNVIAKWPGTFKYEGIGYYYAY
jgi:hypothetical protein